MKKLVNSMVDGVYPLAEGKAAFAKAQAKGTLKVQILMKEDREALRLRAAVQTDLASAHLEASCRPWHLHSVP